MGPEKFLLVTVVASQNLQLKQQQQQQREISFVFRKFSIIVSRTLYFLGENVHGMAFIKGTK